MRRTFALLATICLALAAQSPAAEKKDKQAEGLALIERARELSDIRAPGSPPFRLKARFQFLGLNGGPREGTYTLVWASPTKWRESISFPGFSELRVGGEGQYWQQRNVDYIPLRVSQLRQTLSSINAPHSQTGLKVKKIRNRNEDGISLRCIEVEEHQWSRRTLCYDTASGVLIRDESSGLAIFAPLQEYSGYAPLGRKLFPKSVRRFERGKPIIELTIEELVLEPSPDASLFEPLAGLDVKVFCDGGEPSKLLNHPVFEIPSHLRQPRTSLFFAAYGVVGTDGTLSNVTLLTSSGSDELDAVALKAFRQLRYKPRVCNGAPVEEETVEHITVDIG